VPNLTRDTIRSYARLGAMRRLEELRQELASIRAAFPELFRGGQPASAVPSAKATAADAMGPRRRRRRRPPMSPAQRRAVSQRMKKYWADRRKARG
jgi:hypothetical protein